MADKPRTFKLRISLEGMECNALRGIAELEQLAREGGEEPDHCENLANSARSCISAFRDTILALCKGEVAVEEVKDFWFHNVDTGTVPYRSEVIKFEPKGEAA